MRIRISLLLVLASSTLAARFGISRHQIIHHHTGNCDFYGVNTC